MKPRKDRLPLLKISSDWQPRTTPLYAQTDIPHLNANAPQRDRIMGIDGFEKDLQDIAEANPENKVAEQFLEAYHKVWDKYRNVKMQ